MSALFMWLDAPDQFPNYVLSTDGWRRFAAVAGRRALPAALWDTEPTVRRRVYFTKTAVPKSSNSLPHQSALLDNGADRFNRTRHVVPLHRQLQHQL